MKPPIILDTGPIVALLDRNDSYHSFVAEKIKGVRGQFVTTAAVMTEVFYFLQKAPGGPEYTCSFVEHLPLRIIDTFGPKQLKYVAHLMNKYRDLPMDFADGTLVLLAEIMHAPQILTLDVRGFQTYRYEKDKTFELLLQIQ